MDSKEGYGDHVAETEEEIIDLRKGQWASEEDSKLIDCISIHGPGRWNFLARSAGLNRTGKSCRLRWLNYLHPDVKRGNMTLEEQILILELHSRWGNRWSNIARALPGRTDNEIKNYYRTRVQKLAKLLNCDSNSFQFKDAISRIWLPIMRDRLQAASTKSSVVQQQPTSTTSPHHIASNTTGYGLLEVESNCTKSETPEEAGRVSPANSHLSYVDRDNVLGSDWWGSLQDEAGLITDVTSTTFFVGYYSEQDVGYEGGILMECSGAGLLGGGDSLEYLTLFNHDSAPTWPALNLS